MIEFYCSCGKLPELLHHPDKAVWILECECGVRVENETVSGIYELYKERDEGWHEES